MGRSSQGNSGGTGDGGLGITRIARLSVNDPINKVLRRNDISKFY